MDFLNPQFWEGVGAATACLLTRVALISDKCPQGLI